MSPVTRYSVYKIQLAQHVRFAYKNFVLLYGINVERPRGTVKVTVENSNNYEETFSTRDRIT